MGFDVTGKGPLAVSFSESALLFQRWFGIGLGQPTGKADDVSLSVPGVLEPYVQRVTLAKEVRFRTARQTTNEG